MNIHADTKSRNKQPTKAADAKYESAESYKAGYGGKFGVQSDRFDSSAHRFDDGPVAGAGKTSQHSSVTDSKKGYGGAVRLFSVSVFLSPFAPHTHTRTYTQLAYLLYSDPLNPTDPLHSPLPNQVRALAVPCVYTCTRASVLKCRR